MLKHVFLKTYRALLYWSSIIWSKLSAFRRISFFALFAEDEADFAFLLLVSINTRTTRTYHAKPPSHLSPAPAPAGGFLCAVRLVFFTGWTISPASPSSNGVKVSYTYVTLNSTRLLVATYPLPKPFSFLSSQASQVSRSNKCTINKEKKSYRSKRWGLNLSSDLIERWSWAKREENAAVGLKRRGRWIPTSLLPPVEECPPEETTWRCTFYSTSVHFYSSSKKRNNLLKNTFIIIVSCRKREEVVVKWIIRLEYILEACLGASL